jgi:Rrf2 family cysteine metabolism transcriptional repressor
MHFSTKTRYGARAVLDIAMHGGNGPVTLNEIAKRQEVSKKYVGHIVNQLLAAGILESVRGPQGGYMLARPAKQIRLGEIIRALDGSMAPVRCAEKPDFCSKSKKCAMQEIWITLRDRIDSVVDGVTVADLVNRQKKLDATSA